jgi:hypothetical protein
MSGEPQPTLLQSNQNSKLTRRGRMKTFSSLTAAISILEYFFLLGSHHGTSRGWGEGGILNSLPERRRTQNAFEFKENRSKGSSSDIYFPNEFVLGPERVNGKRREEGAFTENKFLIKKIILLFKKFTHNSAQNVFECEADEEIFARPPVAVGREERRRPNE